MADTLNRDIDAIAGATNFKEMVAAIQKVLRTMAYYISQSEAAVLEYHEGWRDEYTSALDAETAAGARPPKAGRPPKAAARPPKPWGGYDPAAAAAPPGRPPQRPPARPRPDFVPPSLQSIMNGSHSSFWE